MIGGAAPIAGALLTAMLIGPRPGTLDSPWRQRPPTPPEGTEAEADFLAAAEPWRAGLDALEKGVTFEAIDRALSGVALHRCDLARMWQYGQSAEGRALLAIELFAGDPDRSAPAVLVVPDLELDPETGARTACRLVALIAQSERAQRAARWIVVPAPLPDALPRETPADQSTVRGPVPGAAMDFPVEWNPWTSPDVGPYPLSLPETRALAAAIPALQGGALLTVLGGSAGRRAGSLEAFAVSRGWSVLRVDAETLELGEALRELPGLSVGVSSVERISPGLLWIELELSAAGIVDTGRLEASLAGGRFVALASAREGDSGFEALPAPREDARAELGALAPGASVRLRLLVAPEEGRTPSLAITGRRTAAQRVELTLP